MLDVERGSSDEVVELSISLLVVSDSSAEVVLLTESLVVVIGSSEDVVELVESLVVVAGSSEVVVELSKVLSVVVDSTSEAVVVELSASVVVVAASSEVVVLSALDNTVVLLAAVLVVLDGATTKSAGSISKVTVSQLPEAAALITNPPLQICRIRLEPPSTYSCTEQSKLMKVDNADGGVGGRANLTTLPLPVSWKGAYVPLRRLRLPEV